MMQQEILDFGYSDCLATFIAPPAMKIVICDYWIDKFCLKCGKRKPKDWFLHHKGRPKESSVCRPCTNERQREWNARNPQRLLEYKRRWSAKNPGKKSDARRVLYARMQIECPEQLERYNRKRRLKKQGFTEEAYHAAVAAQQGKCAICGSPDPGKGRGFAIDHDHHCCPPFHACKRCFRGLLCHKCNRGLGLFRDSVDYLAAAIKYLTRRSIV